MNDEVWGFVFLSLFAISWASLAAFVGLAVFLIDLLDGLRIYLFMFAAATVLVPTIAFLLDQEWYTWLYWFDINASGDTRIFHTGNWIMNACFFVSVALTYMSKPRLPAELHRPLDRICYLCLIFAVLWAVAGPGGIFLDMVFVPNDEWVVSRLIFVPAFLAVSIATFRWLARLHRRADFAREQSDGGLDKPAATA